MKKENKILEKYKNLRGIGECLPQIIPDLKYVAYNNAGELENLMEFMHSQQDFSDKMSLLGALARLQYKPITPVLIEILPDNRIDMDYKIEAACYLIILEDKRGDQFLLNNEKLFSEQDKVEILGWLEEARNRPAAEMYVYFRNKYNIPSDLQAWFFENKLKNDVNNVRDEYLIRDYCDMTYQDYSFNIERFAREDPKELQNLIDLKNSFTGYGDKGLEMILDRIAQKV